MTARVALRWLHELVILDHASKDGSAEIIAEIEREYPRRVTVLYSSDDQWHEMQHRQAMLDRARAQGATHIAIVDADELLTANMLPGMRDLIRDTPSNHILSLPGYNLRGSPLRYHADGIWGNRFFSLAFADRPELGWSGDRFHARIPTGVPLKEYRPLWQGAGGILHLWGASERRLKAKHALYKLTERIRWPDRPVAQIDREYSWSIHGDPAVREFGTPKTWQFKSVPACWIEPYADLLWRLDIEAVPWQEAQCKALIETHGRGMFKGLDLFGVV